MHLPLGLPSHLFPFTISKQQYKKSNRNKSQKVFWMKTGVCRDIPSKINQTRWKWYHNTFTPSLHLVPFCQLCPPQTLYMHLHVAYSNTLNEQVTQIAHSTVFHWSISAIFSSNTISQHTLHSNIPYRPSTAHALQSSACSQADHICHAEYVHCSHSQHNLPPIHINMHYTPSNTHHTAASTILPHTHN